MLSIYAHAAPLSDLDEHRSQLHHLMWRIRKSRLWSVLRPPRGFSDRRSCRHRVGSRVPREEGWNLWPGSAPLSRSFPCDACEKTPFPWMGSPTRHVSSVTPQVDSNGLGMPSCWLWCLAALIHGARPAFSRRRTARSAIAPQEERIRARHRAARARAGGDGGGAGGLGVGEGRGRAARGGLHVAEHRLGAAEGKGRRGGRSAAALAAPSSQAVSAPSASCLGSECRTGFVTGASMKRAPEEGINSGSPRLLR